MPLRIYQCPICEEEVKTLKNKVPKCTHKGKHVDMEEVIIAPNGKFMVSANAATGKSKLKDQEKILKARARNYSRDKELDDNIQLNRMNGLDESVSKNFLNEKGLRRTKLDDI